MTILRYVNMRELMGYLPLPDNRQQYKIVEL